MTVALILALGVSLLATPADASSNVARNQSIALKQVRQHHWGWGQYLCLIKLFNRESGWNERAGNRYSGAYGIPQSLPGSKMAAAGRDWRTNPATQLRWALSMYIPQRYGTPCRAWAHSQRTGWY